jgi:hypothetical protein
MPQSPYRLSVRGQSQTVFSNRKTTAEAQAISTKVSSHDIDKDKQKTTAPRQDSFAL